MTTHICNEGLSCVLTYAGPHQGTGEGIDKGEYGGQQRAINKEPSDPLSLPLLSLLHPLHFTGHSLPYLAGPRSMISSLNGSEESQRPGIDWRSPNELATHGKILIS